MNGALKTDGSTHGRRPSDWSDPHQAPPQHNDDLRVVTSATLNESFAHKELEEMNIHENHWIERNKTDVHGDLIANALTCLTIELCNAEIRKHKSRAFDDSIVFPTAQHEACARYFISTDNRNTFGRYIVRAALTDQGITASEIAREMRITRKAVTTMVNECIDAGWVATTTLKGSKYLWATPFTLEGFQHYTKFAAENWSAFARQLLDLSAAMRLSKRLEKMHDEDGSA